MPLSCCRTPLRRQGLFLLLKNVKQRSCRGGPHGIIRVVESFLQDGNKLTITPIPTTQRDGHLQCTVQKY